MKALQIYDNGGKTYDRYTLLVPNEDGVSHAMIALSEKGIGINTYAGDIHIQKNYDHLGKKVPFESLNPELKEAIIRRLVEFPEKDGGFVKLWGVNMCEVRGGKYYDIYSLFNKDQKPMTLIEAWESVCVEYHREPTPAEIAYGEGCVHYLDVPLWRAIKCHGKLHARISVNKIRYRR